VNVNVRLFRYLDVPHHSFPETVLACLPSMPWMITEEEVKRREDLRHLDICSVDPPGCTDIDDALHLRELSPNLYEIGVHIADVSHFVRPDTALDKEAANRYCISCGNTVSDILMCITLAEEQPFTLLTAVSTWSLNF
jgi:exoribonuclease R